jgi:NADPH2:quinone reductase
MKAVLVDELGGPDSARVREIEVPGPVAEGQVRVAIEARGISYMDVLMVAGEYQVSQELPFVLGSEAAGRIIELGAEVEEFELGDAVLTSAGCVEEAVLEAGSLMKIPAGINIEAAAAFRSNYQTALYGMQRGRLKAGETLLVHGAAGGVGLAAVDVGKLMGATVIATAGSDQKLEIVSQMGADHVINYSSGFRDQVKQLTDGRGADVIYDPVGGDVFDESMRCIAPFGRILIIGFTGGRPALAKTNHLLIKDAEVIGFTIGALARHNREWSDRNDRILMGWLASGRINPYISHRVPLSRAGDGLKHIINREVIGKVIVVNDYSDWRDLETTGKHLEAGVAPPAR